MATQLGLVQEYEKPPPAVLNPRGYQYQQIQCHTQEHATAVAAEEAKETRDDDTGYDTPGIPKEHLNLEFDKCFQEHKSTFTIPLVHTVLSYAFKYTKLVVYNILVLFFGLPFAILWAFIYGIIVFVLSWIWSPVLRLTLLAFNAVVPLCTEPFQAMFSPLVDVSARFFRQIRIKLSLDGGLVLPLHNVENRSHHV